MFCSNCGKEFDGKFCPECGTPVKEERVVVDAPNISVNATSKEVVYKSKWAALVLCLLGLILIGGLHRFYTGNVLTGVLMILTCGGCGVWTIIDIVMIAGNTYRDGDGNTLK